MHSTRIIVACLAAALATASARGASADAPRPAAAPQDTPGIAAARSRLAGAPRDADRAFALGVALRRAGRLDDAIRALGTAQALGGGREVGRFATWEAARAWADKREVNRAIAVCRGLERGPEGNAFAHVCIAEAQLALRRAGEALAEIALAKVDSSSSNVKLRAKLVAGQARELEMKDDLAEAELREAVKSDEGSADANYLLGRLLARLGKGGEAELRRAVRVEPHDGLALVELAKVLGPTDEAKALLDLAAAERPTDPAAPRALAELHFAKGRMVEAKQAAEVAIAIAPTDVVSRVVHGKVLVAEGKYAEARKTAEAALAAQPNSSAAKLVIADAYAAENEIDLAIEAYQASYGLDHSKPDPLLRATAACIKASRPTSARAFSLRATQDFPDFAPAWIAYGEALDKDGEHGAAAEAYGKALAAPKGAYDRADVQARRERALAAAKR